MIDYNPDYDYEENDEKFCLLPLLGGVVIGIIIGLFLGLVISYV